MLQRMENKANDKSSTRSDSPATLSAATLSAAMPSAATPSAATPSAATPSTAARDKELATRQRFLGVIHNESERLTRLINNLLDVARIEAGRGLGLNCETLDFAAVTAEAIESQRVYSSRHVLVNAVPADLPPLFADRDKVLQILINLLSNAMKYSPGGTVTVAAHIDGNQLVAGVSDEGPGIAPEHRERLFQRFGRIGAREMSTKNPGAGERAKPTGTGLGLFLTRHLVESHGGRIWVESEAGQGARFLFSMPLPSATEE
jgi:signal transduction histidine kinase